MDLMVEHRQIKGILFDLGDTLLDFGNVDVDSLFEAGTRLAYGYLQSLNQPLPPFGRFHRRHLWAIRWNYFKSRLTRREFSSREIMRRLSREMGQNLSPEQINELTWLWYEPLSRCAVVEQGLADMLREFRDAGLTLGIVSNTFVPSEVLDRHLQQENLLDLFPIRVYSCDARYRKPNRRIFAIAAERAGLNAGQTLFVGDSMVADIQGANSAGMISVLKDPSDRHKHSPIRPRHRIHQICQLREIVASYNHG